MSKEKSDQKPTEGKVMLGGFLSGLSALLEKLGELAEKGKELREVGELEGDKLRGVCGFTIRTGPATEGKEPAFKVEPFGNVRKDEQTGRAVVHEVREPLVDVFEEADAVVVVAEMPGVGEEEVRLQLHGDVLEINAAKGDKKYHKEVLLPQTFAADKVSHTCRNGILEIRLAH